MPTKSQRSEISARHAQAKADAHHDLETLLAEHHEASNGLAELGIPDDGSTLLDRILAAIARVKVLAKEGDGEVERREAALRERAREQGAQQRWVTPEGFTQLPDIMLADLGIPAGGHMFFLRNRGRWAAWTEAEVEQMFGGPEDPS
jgi:hypothetical protein